ncbi:phage tail sheath C-terminal domain-containing protein [Methylobacter tundripaludum]|uniref:phage tail sheath C-terminal domain-containing protein n=1 Tax=Methylobacter tundripaludum TaxID=173365 RepID=UPI0004DEDE7F|nr:phage tail sheath C-terminal domain-containing protein [Methylobacter tundripaludum]
MPDNIPFLTIPLDWRVPGAYIEIDHTKAVRGLPVMSHKMLVLGQRLSTGIVAAGILTRVSRKEDGVNYYGRGSMLAQQIEAIMKVNPYTECYALALDDLVAGVAATKIITFTGSPTESGTLYLYIGGRRLTVGVLAAATVTDIATAVAAAINADLDGAVTATSALGVVTATARHKGVEGNDIDFRVNYYSGEFLPKGLSVAFATGATGSGNPDVTAAIVAMSTMNPYTILCGWQDTANITLLENELQSRWGGMDMRTGHVFAHKNGTYASLAAYGAARNSAHSTFSGLNKSPTLPWVISAQFGAAVEFSGANDPAVPFRSIRLPDVMAPAEADRFTDPERNLLLHDGISTIIFDQSGAAMIEYVVTSYQQNSFGMEDVSLLKVNTKWTVDYMRYAFRFAVLRDYPRHKLAGDDVLGKIQPGQPIATPKLIRNTLIAEAMELEKVGLLEDIDQFIKDLIVVRSTSDVNRVNAIIPPNTVNQFDVFAAAVQFIL